MALSSRNHSDVTSLWSGQQQCHIDVVVYPGSRPRNEAAVTGVAYDSGPG
jgi:hypothetical protein